jgi:hypothetical protein
LSFSLHPTLVVKVFLRAADCADTFGNNQNNKHRIMGPLRRESFFAARAVVTVILAVFTATLAAAFVAPQFCQHRAQQQQTHRNIQCEATRRETFGDLLESALLLPAVTTATTTAAPGIAAAADDYPFKVKQAVCV